eukprot:SAG31_NODE_11115_length_1064_cov_2.315026_2_plen_106_part_00
MRALLRPSFTWSDIRVLNLVLSSTKFNKYGSVTGMGRAEPAVAKVAGVQHCGSLYHKWLQSPRCSPLNTCTDRQVDHHTAVIGDIDIWGVNPTRLGRHSPYYQIY